MVATSGDWRRAPKSGRPGRSARVLYRAGGRHAGLTHDGSQSSGFGAAGHRTSLSPQRPSSVLVTAGAVAQLEDFDKWYILARRITSFPTSTPTTDFEAATASDSRAVYDIFVDLHDASPELIDERRAKVFTPPQSFVQHGPDPFFNWVSQNRLYWNSGVIWRACSSIGAVLHNEVDGAIGGPSCMRVSPIGCFGRSNILRNGEADGAQFFTARLA